jgi:hypothetical protein
MQFHEQQVLAGLEGQECQLWSLKPPTRHPSSPHSMYANMGRVREAGGVAGSQVDDDDEGLLLGSSPGGARGSSSSSKPKKDKPSKVAKKQTRFPKRSTK